MREHTLHFFTVIPPFPIRLFVWLALIGAAEVGLLQSCWRHSFSLVERKLLFEARPVIVIDFEFGDQAIRRLTSFPCLRNKGMEAICLQGGREPSPYHCNECTCPFLSFLENRYWTKQEDASLAQFDGGSLTGDA